MMLARSFRKIALVAVAGLALAVVSTPQAMAQGRGGGGGMFGGMFGGGQGQMFEPSVSSRDLDSFARLFGLDASQKEAVKMLFDGYQQQFAAAAKKAREEIDALRDEARDSRDPSLFREIGEKSLAFRQSREQMEQTFLSDFKDVLTEDQAAKWPKFERMRRRETTIGRGLMSGERVDLFELVEDLKLDPEQRAAIEPTLDQYEVDLDRELIQRNKMQEEIQEKMRDFFNDPEAADEWIKKGREAAVKVRDVNRRYFAQLQTQLPEDKRTELERAFKRESFPMIYREQYASRVIAAADRMSDLDESQRQGLASIRETYEREVRTIQLEMEKAQEDQEMNFSIANMMGRRGGGEGGRGNNNRGGGFFGDDTELGKLRAKRRELETSTVEKIRSILTEQQAAKLPGRGDDDDRGFNRGNRDRDGNRDAGNQERRRGGGDNDRPRRPGRAE